MRNYLFPIILMLSVCLNIYTGLKNLEMMEHKEKPKVKKQYDCKGRRPINVCCEFPTLKRCQ